MFSVEFVLLLLCLYAECHYAESCGALQFHFFTGKCRCAKCHGAKMLAKILGQLCFAINLLGNQNLWELSGTFRNYDNH